MQNHISLDHSAFYWGFEFSIQEFLGIFAKYTDKGTKYCHKAIEEYSDIEFPYKLAKELDASIWCYCLNSYENFSKKIIIGPKLTIKNLSSRYNLYGSFVNQSIALNELFDFIDAFDMFKVELERIGLRPKELILGHMVGDFIAINVN